MSYKNKLSKVYTLQFKRPKKFWNVRSIPIGQINYHKNNFSKYFKMPIKNFRNMKVLDTGAGPGLHSTILALMGCDVYAADILKSNVKKMHKFKKAYKLKNLKIFQHDFRKDFNKSKNFDLISCHNWIQHSPNPNLIFKKILKKLKIGGRIYVSCYHSGTFRFFITYIARKLLKFKDFNLLKKETNKFFPKGFKIYKNPDDIYSANIRDDFFSPYCITINYKDFLNLAKKNNLKLYTKVPKIKNLIYLDNIPLRVGLQKTTLKNKFKNNKIFRFPVNEFLKSKCKIRNECASLTKNIIKKFKSKSTSADRVKFTLGLYRIRAKYCRSSGKNKYIELRKFLKTYV